MLDFPAQLAASSPKLRARWLGNNGTAPRFLAARAMKAGVHMLVGYALLGMLCVASTLAARRSPGLAGLFTAAWVDSPADSPDARPDSVNHPDAFTFVRVKYSSSGGYGESWYRHDGRDWERWETDFPRAERNLLFRLNQLTSMRVNADPVVLRLTDPELVDYPFLFMSDVGWQMLSTDEAQALNRYLLRGGFLWIDDFWGDAEWQNLVRNTRKMGEHWIWRPIPPDHPMLSTVYPMSECPQIPARIFFDATGQGFDPPNVHRQPAGGYPGVQRVNLMGLFDTSGRLAAVATHNTDIADGWEREGEDREFFTRFSIQSYAFSINLITYAMTH